MNTTYKHCSKCGINLAMRIIDKQALPEYSKAPGQLVGNFSFPSKTHSSGLCTYCHRREEEK